MLEISGLTLAQRIENLKEWDEEVKEHGDEDLWLYWIMEGVPDGANDADYEEIAADEELWGYAVAAYEFIKSEM